VLFVLASAACGLAPTLGVLVAARAVSVAGGAAFSVGFYGLGLLLSLYSQQARGMTAAETGLAFVPTTGITGVLTLVAPRFAAWFGPRVPMAAGQLLQAAGLLGLCAAVAWAPIGRWRPCRS
jgi:DHA2 family methylenomycin A resistance protein-like MFS transporter